MESASLSLPTTPDSFPLFASMSLSTSMPSTSCNSIASPSFWQWRRSGCATGSLGAAGAAASCRSFLSFSATAAAICWSRRARSWRCCSFCSTASAASFCALARRFWYSSWRPSTAIFVLWTSAFDCRTLFSALLRLFCKEEMSPGTSAAGCLRTGRSVACLVAMTSV